MIRPTIWARVLVGKGRPELAQMSCVTLQTIATRSPGVPWRTIAASDSRDTVIDRMLEDNMTRGRNLHRRMVSCCL